ncbi:MAG: hypothetical protein U0166_05715 [Acidobacteriota bacterium]
MKMGALAIALAALPALAGDPARLLAGCGYQPGELRVYVSTGSEKHPDLAMGYVGTTSDPGGRIHTYRFLQGELSKEGAFLATAWVDLHTDDAGNPVAMEIVTPGADDKVELQATIAFTKKGIVFKTDKDHELAVPEPFREDYERKQFAVFSATVPLMATIPIVQLGSAGERRLSAFYCGVEGYWISYADPSVRSFEGYRVKKHEPKDVKAGGRTVRVRAFEIAPERRLKSDVSTTVAFRRPLVVAADDEGVIYGLEYGTDASWRLERVLALSDVREGHREKKKE